MADNVIELTYNENFDVLVKSAGVSPSWVNTSTLFPGVAVAAEGDSSSPLYGGKCSHLDSSVLGYVSSSATSVMKYGYGGTANSCYSFQILKCSS